MKRIFDIALSIIMIIILTVPMAIVALAIKLTSRGPVLYWSERIGRHKDVFLMPKFRTMKIDTPPVATHLLEDPRKYQTHFGRFLRKFSLDELPQLYSILKGDMTFVGPRPALFNQHDLIEMRTKCGVQELFPGLTGYAQVNGRDEISIPEKVKLDQYYLRNRSFILDIKILWLTVFKVLRSEDINLGNYGKDS